MAAATTMHAHTQQQILIKNWSGENKWSLEWKKKTKCIREYNGTNNQETKMRKEKKQQQQH